MKFDERFWEKVDASGDCWVWTRGCIGDGYGAAYVGKRQVLAHRRSWEMLVGPIPFGQVLDHLCHNRRCVNPDHMESVDRRTNVLRGYKFTEARARNARYAYKYRRLSRARSDSGGPSRQRATYDRYMAGDAYRERIARQRDARNARVRAYNRTPGGRAHNAASFARVRFGEDVPWQVFMELHAKPCVACGIQPSNGVDHIIPRALGGRNVEANLQPMCLPCNRQKRAT